MSSNEDLESYESGAQLALYEEYKNVAELFTYIVETDRRFYLANQVQVTPRTTGGERYFLRWNFTMCGCGMFFVPRGLSRM